MDNVSGRLRFHLLPHAAFIAFVAVMIFAHLTRQDLNVDENVFIASGALLARGTGLVYRDFHYNHMPTQVLIFAGLFKLSDHLLMIARCFTGACAAAAVSAIFVFAHRSLAYLQPRARLFTAAGFGLLLLFNPLFIKAEGKAWNHDLPAAAGLIGLFALLRAAASGRPGRWAMAAGFFAAIAITTRVTFAPTLLAFGLYLALVPGLTPRARLRVVTLFVVGLLIAASPTIWVWAQAPRAAFFGNFTYPRLNTLYHLEEDTRKPVTVVQRLWYVFRSVFTLPGHGVVTIGFIAMLIVTFRPRLIRTSVVQCQLFCVLVLTACLFATSLAAAPMFRQYMYAPTPFMIVGIVLCVANARLADRPTFGKAFAAAVLLCVAFGVKDYLGVASLFRPSQWVPMQVHDDGVRLAARVDRPGPGVERVLTLFPIYPLEGKLDIYPELATGRFGLRVGRYLSDAQEAHYKMADVEDIAAWFATNPPDAFLLVSTNEELEEPLVDAAKQAGYRKTPLGPEQVLYTSPETERLRNNVVSLAR